MTADYLSRLEAWGTRTALISDDVPYTYQAILACAQRARQQLQGKLPPASVVTLVPEFTPECVGALLAMMERGDIVILCHASRLDLVEVDQVKVEFTKEGLHILERHEDGFHPLVKELRQRGHPGLAFLSSGTTGKPKVVLHDFEKLLAIFKDPKKPRRTYAFLPFEQIGGFYSLLYSLSGGGTLICDSVKSPERVARSIQEHKVEQISCNPSFLRLFYMSGAHTRFDLSSLEQINFGTEPMSASTLELLHAALPAVKLRQKFGMSEIGVIGAEVESAVSPFIRLDPKVCETRVRDGLLEVRSSTAMLGYLQGGGGAEQITEDGWLRTGDLVSERGGFLHILGRKTDLINVGGRKVMPQEVEDALQDLPGVIDVLVEGEANAILGQVVRARIVTTEFTDQTELFRKVREHCNARKLEAFKIPQRIVLCAPSSWDPTSKKKRNSTF